MTHVLIVEDHEENRNLLKLLLEVNGFRVTAAGDGLEALEAARRDPPDAIVSDALMPKMDGFALCRAWMQDAALKAIPFIFYSATYVRPEDEKFAAALGAVRYLIKPLESEVFLRELRAALQQWAGESAPGPVAPLDDIAAHALHGSALARKLEDKMAQLEAANRKLQESEARFRSLTEMSSDFYWESDAEHRLTQRSSADKKRSTVSVFERGAQMGERRWEIPYLSPDAAGWREHRAVLDAHRPFRNFELSRLGTDGSERYISISGEPLFDASGGFRGYRGVGTDITERKRADRALRESEIQLQCILESTGDGILAVDGRGKVLRANRHFAEMWRIPESLRDTADDETLLAFAANQLNDPETFLRRVRAHYASDAEDIDLLTFKDGRIFERRSTPLLLNKSILGRVSSFRDITERVQGELALRESEERLNAMFDGALDGILVADAETRRFLTGNPEIGRILGCAPDEIVRMSLADILLPHAMEQFERLLNAEIPLTAGVGLMRKDGSLLYVDIKAARIRFGGREAILAILRDVTERKAAEAKIQRLTQLYAALSQCNEAIVRCTSAEELFPRICRAAVEFGGMEMAWIGVIDPDTRLIRIAASFGDHADEYLQGIEISVDAESPLGRGPSGTAVRENRPVWRQNFQHEPITAPWHERRARFGFGGSASLPLSRDGVPVGVLTLYAATSGAFDEAARRLLVEMATDIGFALDNFAREAARAQAEIDLRATEEQFRGLVEQSIAGIFIIQDDRLAYVNPRFAEIFGYASVDELIGRESLALVIGEERSVVRGLRQEIELGSRDHDYGFTGVRKDGAKIEVGVHGARATHEGRPAIIGMLQDISEKKRAEEQIQIYLAQLETAFISTVEVATTLGEMRDPYTAGHQRRVAEIAVAIGAELGFDERRQEGLRVAGYLHDIGKITIPAEILSKPGKLTRVEFTLIQGHAQSSYDVLKDVKFPWPIAEVALQHHERVDGSGYPQGLKGEAILLEARIMAVADVIEAMSSHRPYRAGLGIDKALAEIERGRGSAYDAQVADACLCLFRERGYSLPE